MRQDDWRPISTVPKSERVPVWDDTEQVPVLVDTFKGDEGMEFWPIDIRLDREQPIISPMAWMPFEQPPKRLRHATASADRP